MNKNLLRLPVLMLGSALLVVSPLASAKEGADQYPNGVSGYAAGQLPPPGTYLLNYMGYSSGTLKDADGNDDFRGVTADAIYETPRIVHVSTRQALGGNLFFHGLIPIVHLDGEVALLGAHITETGIGDLNAGVGISWPGQNLSIAASFDVYAPTGQYDENQPLNIGANYWSFEPVLAMTLLSEQGAELSFKAMYNIKLENDDTDVQSGDELKVDYHIGKRWHSDQWGEVALGIGGYYVNQLDEDENNGIKVPGSDGKVIAAGPQLKFNLGPAPVIIHYEKEFDAKSRLEGERLLLQVNYRF